MLIEVPPCCPLSKQFKRVCCAPVAQMDRALASGAKGRGFESLLARHLFLGSGPEKWVTECTDYIGNNFALRIGREKKGRTEARPYREGSDG